MKATTDSYIPALRFHWLTRFYDPVVRLTTREARFKRELLGQACIKSGQRVLDLGCGTGTLAIMVKSVHLGAEVFGLDADSEALQAARRKSEEAGISVRLDQGMASAMPYANVSFDRILSSLFFHHLSSEVKHEAILEAFRVLCPGGEFHIADWGKPTNPAMRLAFIAVQFLDGFATTRDSVAGVLPDFLMFAGFKSVEITNSFSTPLGTICLYRARKPLA